MRVPRINRARFNAYRVMWVYVFFDLPVQTKADRKRYTDFRKSLLKFGFTMVQFSVYHRYCASFEQVEVIKKRVKQTVPVDGLVSVMVITDKQFGNIAHFCKGKPGKKQEIPGQLMFF
jgi:CRISPR-associated protein Cas2